MFPELESIHQPVSQSMSLPLRVPFPLTTAIKPRELFKNRAYDELRSRFSNCSYVPGTFLSERQLAAELGMSKTPVKAALERLEMEGFITVSPQSGIIVRELGDEEIADIYEIRIALEGYAVREIASCLTEQQLEQWEATLSALEKIANQPQENRLQVVELDEEFHSLPIQFLGNQQILQTMHQLSAKNKMVVNSVFSLLPDRAGQSLYEHRQIVAAARAGDGVIAGQLMETHIRVGHEILCAARKKPQNQPN